MAVFVSHDGRALQLTCLTLEPAMRTLLSAPLLTLALLWSGCAHDSPSRDRGTTPASAPSQRTRIISLVGTNDLHGYIRSLPLFGGYLNNLRAARAADGGGVLLVDAGDIFQGTLESNPVEGASVIRGYNALRYDAAAVGNHEFDFGPEGSGPIAPDAELRGALFARARQAHFPILTANIIDRTSGKLLSAPNLKPSVLIEVAGVRVGLIGVATSETPGTTRPRLFAGLDVTPLAAAIEREGRALRSAGATVVVVSAHAGAECESFDDPDKLDSCRAAAEIFDVARALPPGLVDAIVAGHTHARVAHRVGGIPIIESAAQGRAFGRIDLVVDATGHVVSNRPHPPQTFCADASKRPPCAAASYEGAPVQADAQVAAAIAEDLERADRLAAENLGVTLDGVVSWRNGESAIGNLVADLMLAARPDADVALTHGGGLRADLPAGALTYGALFQAEPSDNTFAYLRMSAREFGELLARNLQGTAGFLTFAGVRAEAVCERGALRVQLTRPDQRKLRDDEMLLIVTNSFLATGGANYVPINSAERVEDQPVVRDELAAVLRKRGGHVDPAALRNSAAPRIAYPGERPVRCSRSAAQD